MRSDGQKITSFTERFFDLYKKWREHGIKHRRLLEEKSFGPHHFILFDVEAQDGRLQVSHATVDQFCALTAGLSGEILPLH